MGRDCVSISGWLAGFGGLCAQQQRGTSAGVSAVVWLSCVADDVCWLHRPSSALPAVGSVVVQLSAAPIGSSCMASGRVHSVCQAGWCLTVPPQLGRSCVCGFVGLG